MHYNSKGTISRCDSQLTTDGFPIDYWSLRVHTAYCAALLGVSPFLACVWVVLKPEVAWQGVINDPPTASHSGGRLTTSNLKDAHEDASI